MSHTARYVDPKKIRNQRFDEQGGLCCYCQRPMIREMGYISGGGQPHDLCTLEHLTDRLDPSRWDRNVPESQQRYAAACARCNNARSEWVHMHTPNELIQMLARNPLNKKGREIVMEYYEHHEYVSPPPFIAPPPVTLEAGSGKAYPKKWIDVPKEPEPLSVSLRAELLRVFCGGE